MQPNITAGNNAYKKLLILESKLMGVAFLHTAEIPAEFHCAQNATFHILTR